MIAFLVLATMVWASPRTAPSTVPIDAQNADRVDDHHAGPSDGTKSQRANRVLWAGSNGKLSSKALPMAQLDNRYLKRKKDTFHYVPGVEAVLGDPGEAELYYFGRGMVQVRKTGSPGDIMVFIPISLPACQNGRWVKVENIQVYYELDNASSYITGTYLLKLNATNGEFFFLINDETHRTSTSWTDYSLNCGAASCALSSPTGGFLTFGVTLSFAGTGEDHDIFIGGVTVRVSYQ